MKTKFGAIAAIVTLAFSPVAALAQHIDVGPGGVRVHGDGHGERHGEGHHGDRHEHREVVREHHHHDDHHDDHHGGERRTTIIERH
ncbi:hypothetical protein ASF27_11965 [Methylobacterium sp. Leaf102]|uniref:Uncharacterized protein n=2 Tax=Methylobacterium TaxID=407 RepID=A0A679J560_9HYPH|nr:MULTISPECIES: hypothetical protein [Methylobacterium]GJE17239.1 hypothetical protein AIGOOFII_1952 [Methylobacterium marchantiae]KQO85921.1 hypothetical protein ASF32_09550 [Methylobacterium sp. Leaf91]KQP18537.1 hypothetical protein ASF25_11840 [Methylobacterium sp. Leaf100]KQP23878.1 hypothetical protein ASF27_11965 [Methylobacterium sp. Leaf102]MBD8904973.1 hypothetical protein [Methylobacterium bullatum]